MSSYFDAIKRLLKPHGRAVLQAITIADDKFEAYRSDSEFIQKYIFPGGFLPSRSLLENHVRKAGLRLESVETFGSSYARTLAEWRLRFHANWSKISAQGFDVRFHRMWDYYLSYCEAGFREGVIDVGIYVIQPTQAGR